MQEAPEAAKKEMFSPIRLEQEDEIEEQKQNMLREAFRLRDEYFADPDNWVRPEDYENSAEAERQLRLKANNKFRKNWFGQMIYFFCDKKGGWMSRLPDSDADKQEIERRSKDLVEIVFQEMRRVNQDDKKVIKEAICDDEAFIRFCKDSGLEENDKVVLFMCVSKNQFEQAVKYLWSLETVEQRFEGSHERFRDWFKDQFDGWVSNYFALERKYKAIGPQAVEAADAILDIVVEVLSRGRENND